jgi:hypothetical protein
MKKIIAIFITIFIVSCAGNREEKLAKLDKAYGYCDNPHRTFGNKIEYEACKAKERAAPNSDGSFKEPKSLREIIGLGTGSGGTNSGIYNIASVNNQLWQASLNTLKDYSLITADFEGGYIETDWIYKIEDFNSRCKIKINITSAELISTGVSTYLFCEEKINDIWVNDKFDYTQDAKQLTIKILNTANTLSQNS